jgi:hypothetical protein
VAVRPYSAASRSGQASGDRAYLSCVTASLGRSHLNPDIGTASLHRRRYRRHPDELSVCFQHEDVEPAIENFKSGLQRHLRRQWLGPRVAWRKLRHFAVGGVFIYQLTWPSSFERSQDLGVVLTTAQKAA